MPSAAERSDLNPPAERASVRAFALALLAHLLLGAALTWGINWKQADPQVSFSAELWSPSVQEAAPAPSAVEPPPPVTVPVPAPAPPPPAPPQAVTPPAPALPKADIAIEKEKKRKQKEADERKALAEKEKADKAAKAEEQAKADKARKLREAREAKAAAEAQAKADAQKLKAKKEQDAKKQAAAEAAAEAAADAKRRKEVMDRLGTAGATGAPDAKGSALQASGPSASYGGKVRAKVKPNVVFTEEISGNPTAEVEVRTTPDGTIISQRLIKSSGNKAWDDAVIKALIRTETLPRDVDGRVPTPLIITFRPKD